MIAVLVALAVAACLSPPILAHLLEKRPWMKAVRISRYGNGFNAEIEMELSDGRTFRRFNHRWALYPDGINPDPFMTLWLMKEFDRMEALERWSK